MTSHAPDKKRTVQLLLLLLFLSLAMAGCAALTRSQVAEVQEFARSTQGFGGLPGTVIEAYRDVRAEGLMLQLATNTYSKKEDAEAAWKDIMDSRRFSHDLTRQVERLDHGLRILDTYADLLVQLSSDHYTDELDQNAARLGMELDRGVQAYNNRYRQNLGLIASSVAALVRGIGGLYIRHKQAKLLQLYVQAADPMVETLTRDVESLLNPFVHPSDFAEAHLQAELTRLQKLFITEAVQSGKDLQLSTAQGIGRMIARIEQAKELAKISQAAAEKYRGAHAKLKEALTHKKTIRDRIEAIRSLADETETASKLKRSLER